MRDLLSSPEIDRYRMRDRATVEWFGDTGDHETGAFLIPSPIDRQPLLVIATSGMGWDRVSVSRRRRPPNQTELSLVHRMFFQADETVVQYFVPEAEHVNNHPFCLHLWRPLDAAFPKPPAWMVGVRGRSVADSVTARAARDECEAAMLEGGA